MKYLDYNGLTVLSNAIKGDLSSFTDTVIPTFEEVYSNLFTIDQDIEEHKEGEVTDPDGIHGIRYADGAFQVANPTYAEASPVSGSNPKELGLYELVNGNYVLTDDEEIVSGKTYYTRNDSWDDVITKPAGSVTTTPSFSQKTYNGSAQTIATAGDGTGTMYYCLSNSSTAPSRSSYSTTLPTLTDATDATYYLWYYAGASSSYKATTPDYVTWIGSANNMLMQKAEPTITKSKSSVSLSTAQMSDDVTITVVTDGTYTVTSSDTSVATVTNTSDNTYHIAVVANGTCTINIDVAEGSNYAAASDTISVSCALVNNTLDNNDWSTISAISEAGTGSTYWSVGDCKAITLNGTVGTLSLSNVTTYVYILGFNHNSSVEGTGITFGGFKTAATGGTDVCLCDGSYNTNKYDGSKIFNLNHWGTNSGNYNTNFGGWAACDARYDILGSTDSQPTPYGSTKTTSATGVNASSTCATNPVANTLMAALPSDLRAVMKPITKYTDNKGNSSTAAANVTATIDYLPLPAEKEIFGSISYANSNEGTNQAQYAYYANNNSKVKYKHNGTTTAACWWLRSPYRSGAYDFVYVYADGSVNDYSSRYSLGLAPLILI